MIALKAVKKSHLISCSCPSGHYGCLSSRIQTQKLPTDLWTNDPFQPATVSGSPVLSATVLISADLLRDY